MYNQKEYDFKVYYNNNDFSDVVLEGVKKLFELNGFHKSYMKLLEDEKIEENTAIGKEIRFRINRISKTSAFGLKKLVITDEETEKSLVIKPLFMVIFLFSKVFADNYQLLSHQVPELIAYLSKLGYNAEFYVSSYDKLIPKVYFMNRKLQNGSEDLVLEEVQNITLDLMVRFTFGIKSTYTKCFQNYLSKVIEQHKLQFFQLKSTNNTLESNNFIIFNINKSYNEKEETNLVKVTQNYLKDKCRDLILDSKSIHHRHLRIALENKVNNSSKFKHLMPRFGYFLEGTLTFDKSLNLFLALGEMKIMLVEVSF